MTDLPNPIARALLGTVLDGKYEIVRVIGEGGMGVVFEARHRLIARRLAVKVLHPDVAREPELVERFHNEARIAGALGHENVIEVTDMGTLDSGSPYIVMEYLEGESLARRIADHGPLAIPEAVEVVAHVLHALTAVHQAGVVHRDLKPDNVFLAERRRGGDGRVAVKLLDFGISKLRRPEGAAPALTRTGAVLGTPHYMAPEQAEGRKDVDHRVDVYAAGVILYEALTGRRPFEGETFAAVVYAVATKAPSPPRSLRFDIPAGLEAIVLRAMSREPSARFATAREFLDALVPYAPAGLESSLTRAPRESAPTRAAVGTPTVGAATRPAMTPPARGGRIVIAAGAAGLLAAGALALLLADRGGGARVPPGAGPPNGPGTGFPTADVPATDLPGPSTARAASAGAPTPDAAVNASAGSAQPAKPAPGDATATAAETPPPAVASPDGGTGAARAAEGDAADAAEEDAARPAARRDAGARLPRGDGAAPAARGDALPAPAASPDGGARGEGGTGRVLRPDEEYPLGPP